MSKMTVLTAARLMGVTPQYIRMGLRQGVFPFGDAVKMRQWVYRIDADKFNAYLGVRKREGNRHGHGAVTV